MRRFDWGDVDGECYFLITGDRLPSGCFVGEVFDQHSSSWCGCCFLVSATQMVEDRMRISLSKKRGISSSKDKVDLQAVMDEFYDSEMGWNVCHGGFPFEILECIRDGRCPLLWRRRGEGEWLGYARIRERCRAPFGREPLSSVRRIQERDVKQDILTYGPIVLEVNAATLKSADDEGVLTDLTPRASNHSVTVIGWKERGWIVRNTWGLERVPTDIPSDLGCVARGRNDCEVEFEEWVGDPLRRGHVYLPFAFEPLHDSANPPWISAIVNQANAA